jgi:hypothetical protein
MRMISMDEFHPWDSDHTALVHVLWAAEREGITVRDADRLASFIMQSKWMQAVRLHIKEN